MRPLHLSLVRRTLDSAAAALTSSLLVAVLAPGLQAQAGPIDIPFERFELDNGLTVIVHEDRKAPIVAVNVWYHVGSKNERPGKTGFAHLFEHLMFNGSENYNDDYFRVLEPLGATNLNGTTNFDRTNYFQNVPTSGLDVALWMESDRMGHLLGAIDQDRLDEQRGVVQNEKRQGENQPYGQVLNWMLPKVFPTAHPYSWSVIGSMDDLNAASLDDVQEWFRSYYGPSNAVLVLAGDIDVESARAKVEHYFADIPAGPPVARPTSWVPRPRGTQRMVAQDRVAQARIYKVWHIPEWGSDAVIDLSLFRRALTGGKSARLERRLIQEEGLVTDVSISMAELEIGGLLMLEATAHAGGDLVEIERIIDEELSRILAEGVTATEVRRAATRYRAEFIRGIEQVGGFGGKSDILAQNQIYRGDPGFFRTRLERVASATPERVTAAAREWLSDGQFVIEVHPFGERAIVAQGADRSELPDAGDPPAAVFPTVERRALANGLEIVLARRPAVPVVEMRLMIDAGGAADIAVGAGTASLTLEMLDEGTGARSADDISDALLDLGATLATDNTVDASTISMSALSENLGASLDLFAEVVLDPSFAEGDFERIRAQRIATIQSESLEPLPMALRVMPELLYGEGHPYSLPFSGNGSEEVVAGLAPADLRDFHQQWFLPNNATLLVVGDTDMETLARVVEGAFGGWASGDVPVKAVAEVDRPAGQMIYVMDRPGAQQSVIMAGHVATPRSTPDNLAITTMNTSLGGAFTSRINLNLREEKGWSYGAASLLFDARGQRPFLVYAPVQTDRTSESVMELVSELNDLGEIRPITQEELDFAVNTATLTLPGSWETNGAVLTSLQEMVEFGLPGDHFDTLEGRTRAMTLEEVNAAARSTVHPEAMIWVVVGDKAVIEEGLRGLGIGPVFEIDADGNVKGRLIGE